MLTADELELLRGLGVFVGHLSVFIELDAAARWARTTSDFLLGRSNPSWFCRRPARPTTRRVRCRRAFGVVSATSISARVPVVSISRNERLRRSWPELRRSMRCVVCPSRGATPRGSRARCASRHGRGQTRRARHEADSNPNASALHGLIGLHFFDRVAAQVAVAHLAHQAALGEQALALFEEQALFSLETARERSFAELGVFVYVPLVRGRPAAARARPGAPRRRPAPA